jgi:hypothetical protein
MRCACKKMLVFTAFCGIVAMSEASSAALINSIPLRDEYVIPDHATFSWTKAARETDIPMPLPRRDSYSHEENFRAVDSFPAPDTFPWGLAPGNNCIWLGDLWAMTIYKIDPMSGTVLRQFTAPDQWTKDLAFDGTYLWASGNFGSSIYKIDTISGGIINIFNSPEINPLGITFDGTYLWHASHPGTNSEPTQVYKIDPANGQVLASFPLPFHWANGLAYKDGHLLVCDSDLGIIYEIDPNTGMIMDACGSPGTYPLGLAYDGINIWNVDFMHDYVYYFRPDFAPPAIALNQPLAARTYPTWQPLAVVGTITAYDLISWGIEYAQGETPVTWTLLDSLHTTPAVYDTLASWDVSGLDQDYYWLRINATCSAGVDTTHQVRIYIDPDIMAGWPQECPNISPVALSDLGESGDQKVIAGTNHNNFPLTDVTVWDLAGSTLWQSPTGVYNTHTPAAIGDVDNTGLYEIATGFPAWAYTGDSCPVNLMTYGGGVYPNWPRYGRKVDGFWATVSAVLADMDGDDDLEIFAGGLQLHGWHHEGTGYTGAFVGSTVSDPAIGDIDGDSLLDFVFKNGMSIDVRDHDGNTISGFPVSVPASGRFTSPVIGDINNDGAPEIVFALENMNVYVLDTSGSMVGGWPQTVGGSYTNSPVLGDIDNDDDLEIIMVSGVFPNFTRISVFEHTGAMYPGWPLQLNGKVFRDWNAPVIGDVNGDSVPDIVMGFETVSEFEEVYAWDKDGTVLGDWPKIIGEVDGYGITGSPVLGDFDSDGNVNMAISSNAYWVANTEIYVWDLPHPYLESTMEWPQYRHDLHRTANHLHVDGVGILEHDHYLQGCETAGMSAYPSVGSRISVLTRIPVTRGPGQLSVFDASGRLVHRYADIESGIRQTIVDFTTFDRPCSNGVFFIMLELPETVLVEKVVFMR